MTEYSLVPIHCYEPSQEVLQFVFCLDLKMGFCIISLPRRIHKRILVWIRYNQSHPLVNLPKYGGFSHSGKLLWPAIQSSFTHVNLFYPLLMTAQVIEISFPYAKLTATTFPSWSTIWQSVEWNSTLLPASVAFDTLNKLYDNFGTQRTSHKWHCLVLPFPNRSSMATLPVPVALRKWPSLSVTCCGLCGLWDSKNDSLLLQIWQVATESSIQLFASSADSTWHVTRPTTVCSELLPLSSSSCVKRITFFPFLTGCQCSEYLGTAA